MKGYNQFLNEGKSNIKNTVIKGLISTGLKFDWGWSEVFEKDGEIYFVSTPVPNKQVAKESFEEALEKTARILKLSKDDFITKPMVGIKTKRYVVSLPLSLVEGIR
jgi:hypothetical protein